MTRRKDLFDCLNESRAGRVKFGDNSAMDICGEGSILGKCLNGEELELKAVLYTPQLCVNILSLGQLDGEGYDIKLQDGFLSIYDQHGKLLTKVCRSDGQLYRLKLDAVNSCLLTKEQDEKVWLWHRHFGHLNFRTLKSMAEKVIGMPSLQEPMQVCRSCISRKHQRSFFPSSSRYRSTKHRELVYGDICGPITPSTLGGSRYFFLLIDDYSRLIWVSMLKNKSEAFQVFKNFKELEEKEKETKIKCFRTDRGGEFMSEEFVNFCDEHGIKRQLTTPYSP